MMAIDPEEVRHDVPDLPGMEFVRSQQHKGILYECQRCGKRVWSGFGNARRHAVHGWGCPAR